MEVESIKKCPQERLTRGTVTSTMRRAARPSGCARCGAGAGCLVIQYQSLLVPGPLRDCILRFWVSRLEEYRFRLSPHSVFLFTCPSRLSLSRRSTPDVQLRAASLCSPAARLSEGSVKSLLPSRTGLYPPKHLVEMLRVDQPLSSELGTNAPVKARF
jgi:hypothetical protein